MTGQHQIRETLRRQEGIVMVDYVKVSGAPATSTTATALRRRAAWILILIADVVYFAWGAMAAVSPDALAGPGGTPILAAGYEGFSNGSWAALATTSPMTAEYLVVLFRMYGVFNAIFGFMAIAITVTSFRRGEAWAWWTLLIGNTAAYVSAMTYDRTVNAIGPFEMLEYVGLALILIALAMTAPFLSAGRPIRSTR
jgi:hypothetical protein